MRVRIQKFRRVSPLVEELSTLPPHAGRTNPSCQSGRLPLVHIQYENQVPEDAVLDASAPGVLVEDAAPDDGPDAGAGPEPDSNADSESDSESDSKSDSDADSESDSESNSDADPNANPEPDPNANPESDSDAKCWGIGEGIGE